MGKGAPHGHLISVSFGRLGYNYAERVWENIVPQISSLDAQVLVYLSLLSKIQSRWGKKYLKKS